ncbi:hypothetical protein HDV57DRAFT_505373 [Trichoderma longibrachiatum]
MRDVRYPTLGTLSSRGKNARPCHATDPQGLRSTAAVTPHLTSCHVSCQKRAHRDFLCLEPTIHPVVLSIRPHLASPAQRIPGREMAS